VLQSEVVIKLFNLSSQTQPTASESGTQRKEEEKLADRVNQEEKLQAKVIAFSSLSVQGSLFYISQFFYRVPSKDDIQIRFKRRLSLRTRTHWGVFLLLSLYEGFFYYG